MTLWWPWFRPRPQPRRYTCAACWGAGQIWRIAYDPSRTNIQSMQYTRCEACNGTGYIEYREDA